MTREEAIELKAAVGRLMYSNNKDVRDYNALIDFIESALRPVSREQVEKVFSGCALCNWGGLDYVGLDGDGIYLNKPPKDEKFRFCPACGKPMTDEAVEMVIERLEALKDAGD